MAEVVDIQADLAKAQAALNNPAIQKHPGLLSQARARLVEIEGRVAAGTKVAKPSSGNKAPKKDKVMATTKEKPKGKLTHYGRLKIGSKVKWFYRPEQKTKTGTIASFYYSNNIPGKVYARVLTREGKKHDAGVEILELVD